MPKPSVLFVATTFPLSLEKLSPHFMHSLALGLSERYEMHVLAPHAPGAKTFERQGDLHVHRFRYAPGFMEQLAYGSGIIHNIKAKPWLACVIPSFILVGAIVAMGIVFRRSISIVHVNWLVPFGPVFAFLRPLLGYRLVITSLGADLLDMINKEKKHGFISVLIKWTISKADVLTVLSTRMKDRLIEITSDHLQSRVEVIPLGIDLNTFWSDKKFDGDRLPNRILFVGRLVEVKGCDILLEALSDLKLRGLNYTCTIAGDGHERPELEKRAAALGLTDKVTFIGQVDNFEVSRLMSKHDIFVVPSRREAFGVVFLEAMASGLAIVASETHGQIDLIAPEENGLVVGQESSESLAASLARLMAEPRLAQKLVRSGQQKVLRYSWEYICNRYASVYETLSTQHK